MAEQKATNIKWHHGKITKEDRTKLSEPERSNHMAYRSFRFREIDNSG